MSFSNECSGWSKTELVPHKSDHIEFFTAESAALEGIDEEIQSVVLAAIGCQLGVGLDAGDSKSRLLGCDAEKTRSAPHVQEPPAADAADIDDARNPLSTLFNADRIVSDIVHIGGGKTARALTAEIIVDVVKFEQSALRKPRVLKKRGCNRGSDPKSNGTREDHTRELARVESFHRVDSVNNDR